MERENYLKEQIDSYIDQLDLLGMQETIDAERIDKVVARVKELATEYISLLDGRVESQIQGIEKRFAVTLEEELEKRNQIYTVVNQKLQEILAMFSDVKKIEVASDLWSYISEKIDISENQVHEYESDIKLVEEQFDKIKAAEQREAELNEERTQAYVKKTNLRNAQLSFETLNEEILEVYSRILKEGNASQLDFQNIKAKEKALKKRQNQLLENLELARSAKDAEGYVATYEARVKKNELELDKVAEQTFLHLLGKMMQSPVDSYESLEKRTKIVQGIVSSRISKVEQLYQEGVIENGEYETLASRIDHSRIYRQLSDLAELEKNEELIISIEEQLQHTRDEVKGKEDLELIFAERAKERGRIAIVPEAPEILFEDEQVNRDRKRRRQIISIEPAKKSLLEKLGKAKDSLLSTLRTIGNIPGKIKEQIEKMIEVPVKYKPTIGDQIELREKAVIYSNPMDIVEEKGRKEAKEVSLIGTKLFVTRGAILDHTGTPIYITTEYGVDLETVAKNMNLSEGTYNIVLGCSIGDADGKFIAVTDDKLNADIEKGWINAADANIMVLCQLNEEQKKGGIKK